MCRNRPNRTDECRPFRSGQCEGTRQRARGVESAAKGETFRELGCDARPCARLGFLREARIPAWAAECAGVRRKRGEQLLSCQRRPLNLPADLFTIVARSLRRLRPRSVDFAFLSYVLLGLFRRVILLLRLRATVRPDFSLGFQRKRLTV